MERGGRMRPTDLTSVERQVLGQLGSAESLSFGHHSTPWIAKHEQRLRPLVTTVQRRDIQQMTDL